MVDRPRREDIYAMARGNQRLARAIEGLFETAGNEGLTLDELADLIDANTANITTNAGDIASLTSSLSSLTSTVNTNTSNISTNTTDIADHETRISDLETAVAALEAQMAAIAAVTSPSGGSTVDSQSRTAIDAIISAAT
jgi:chromosome segregation ATPase